MVNSWDQLPENMFTGVRFWSFQDFTGVKIWDSKIPVAAAEGGRKILAFFWCELKIWVGELQKKNNLPVNQNFGRRIQSFFLRRFVAESGKKKHLMS